MAKPTVVDFTNVTAGGRVRIPEGDYRVAVKSVKHDTSKAGDPMLVWEFELVEGKHKGKVLKDYTSLTPKALWKLKGLLEAMGITVPNKRVALRLEKYAGVQLGITAIDDEYEGKISSKVGDYISEDVLDADDEEEDEDLEDEEDEEEEEEEPEPPKKSKKSKKSKKVEDDEEIEDLDLDEI
jgi:Protein of unknown function (DUF669)